MSFSLGDEGVDTVEEALLRIPLLIDSYQSSAEVILEIQDKQNQPERQKQPGTNTTQNTAATCTTIKTDGLMVKELRQKLASFTNLYGFSNACIYHMQQIICIKRNNSPKNCIC